MKATVTALVVDDEKAPRENLLRMLSEHAPHVYMQASCSNGADALKALHKQQPELVFVDVEMPEMNGFEFLEKAGKQKFHVIFTTSHASYAVRALRIAAIDFLLKPYTEQDLLDALERYEQVKEKEGQQDRMWHLLNNLAATNPASEKLALPTATGFLFARIDEIIRLESSNSYSTIFTKDRQQIVVSRTLKECEELLSDKGFLRVHQSHMINLRFIKKYIKGEGGTVELEDGTSVEVSRRKKEEFLAALRRM
jgi:two-component system, LytTR family, response regulator